MTIYSSSLDQYGTDTAMGENTTSKVFTLSYNMTNETEDNDTDSDGPIGITTKNSGDIDKPAINR